MATGTTIRQSACAGMGVEVCIDGKQRLQDCLTFQWHNVNTHEVIHA